MTLKRRILAGFLVVVLLGVLQSLIASVALTQIRQDVERIRGNTAPLAQASRLATLVVLQLRQNEYDRLRGHPDAVDAAGRAADAKTRMLKALGPVIDAIGRDVVRRIDQAIVAYGRVAEKLARAMQQRGRADKGAIGSLNNAAAELEEVVAADPKLNEAYMKSRLAEQAYRLAVDPATTEDFANAQSQYKIPFKDGVAELTSVLATNTEIDPSLKTRIESRRDAYDEQFDRLLKCDLVVAEQAAELRLKTAELQSALGQIENAAGTSLDAELQNLYDGVRHRVMWIMATGLVGIILGAVIAFVLANEIIRPITRLREAADRISLGELDVQLDEPKTDDEIAGLTKAFQRMVTSIRTLIQQEPP